MKTCFLNLPHPARIMRRYSCTYYAPNFLFPPLELMSLAGIIKNWKKGDCIIIDAIAEGLNLGKVIERLRVYQPDFLVFMAGIESFREDKESIKSIKRTFPSLKIACVGYLPSLFPEETLKQNPEIDYVIIGEPELSFADLYDYLSGRNTSASLISGIAYREYGRITVGPQRERIRDLDILTHPARNLIRQGLYNEFLFRRPFSVIQTSRGCPFECSFCVNTYGKEVAYRSIENVLSELDNLSGEGIKALRFMDDTFTLNKSRCRELCAGIIRRGLKFDWSCLSRVDGLDKGMLALMKKSGCRRIYLGIETFSQRLLDYYRKGYDFSLIRRQVKAVRENKIEAVGFFIVGGLQTEEEFKRDITLAKETGLDYIVVEKLTPYPGTAVYGNQNAFISQDEVIKRERRFYQAFYLRPGYLFRRLGCFLNNARDTLRGLKRLGGYLASIRPGSLRPEMI